MRIISTPKSRELKQSCRDCKTAVACEPSDFTYVPDSRDGDAVKWTCPTCKHENYIATSRIPAGFMRLLRIPG